MNAAAEVIYDLVDPSANLIFGAVIDQSLSGQVSLEGLEISGVNFYLFIYNYPCSLDSKISSNYIYIYI